MPLDSDPIVLTGREPDDFTSVFTDMIGSIQFKLFGLMFATFIFLCSDMFIGRVLSQFSHAVDGKTPTSWGVVLQGLFLVFACIGLDACIRQGIV